MLINRTFRIAAFLLAVIFVSCDIYDPDVEESFYQTYGEAIDKGAVNRGWVPDFIPSDAIKIFERHNIDSNEITIKFNYFPSNLSPIYRSCNKIERSQAQYPRRSPRWWSDNLKPSAAFFNGSSYEFFLCNVEIKYESSPSQKRTAFLALDNTTLTAWFWQF
ncbi:hypothetical protein MCHI_003371 [Candidatus Magnetoovum chiemensis]|nr:hypothetical protein MCHI_003371 [Candidatus Magnetoovum chiemensis]